VFGLWLIPEKNVMSQVGAAAQMLWGAVLGSRERGMSEEKPLSQP